MPRLIDTKANLLANPWVLLAKDCTLETAVAAPDSHLIVPANLWLVHKEDLQKTGKQLAVWLDSDQTAKLIANDLGSLSMIALNFPLFMDGRAYSTATILRKHYHYEGEIRAIGDVLRDQLFMMKRCGFTTFDLRDTVKMEDAATAFNDFSNNYQTTVETPEPLFRRRG
ncbi:MAG: DUF934 domain-containing protein [Pseudomonadota bacterium]